MEWHPYAKLFPVLGDKELEALADDIRENGLRNPIIVDTHERIIDGRNRSAACVLANKEPVLEVFSGSDEEILKLVVSLNVHRRHLNESQRAMIASKIATMPKGAPVGNRNNRTEKSNGSDELFDFVPEGVSQRAAAAALNVSVPSVKRAHVVQRFGSEELQDKVSNGEVSVTSAAKIARLPEPEQEAALSAPSSHQEAAAVAGNRSDIGIQRAHEAIACLKKIPRSDKFRERAFQIVKDWMRTNK